MCIASRIYVVCVAIIASARMHHTASYQLQSRFFHRGATSSERKSAVDKLFSSLSPHIKASELLCLERIRGSMIRQEETIIFALIERAAYKRNEAIYTTKMLRIRPHGKSEIFDRDATLLEYVLCETEKVHASVGRYLSLEEIPFFPGFLPPLVRPKFDVPNILAPNDINITRQLLQRYPADVIPSICEAGDDEQHGSSVLCDINILQAICRRVHFGRFVAESKFQSNPKEYQHLCSNADVKGVNETLTNIDIEAKVIDRAYKKAHAFAQEIENERSLDPAFKVEPFAISEIYRNFIIPLTKEVEVRYLFQRTGYLCPPLEEIAWIKQ